jgi:hypothetical protein
MPHGEVRLLLPGCPYTSSEVSTADDHLANSPTSCIRYKRKPLEKDASPETPAGIEGHGSPGRSVFLKKPKRETIVLLFGVRVNGKRNEYLEKTHEFEAEHSYGPNIL